MACKKFNDIMLINIKIFLFLWGLKHRNIFIPLGIKT